jgi:hypothetical protein
VIESEPRFDVCVVRHIPLLSFDIRGAGRTGPLIAEAYIREGEEDDVLVNPLKGPRHRLLEEMSRPSFNEKIE